MSVGSANFGGRDVTFVAAADLSSYQYCAVYVSAAGKVNVQTTNNGRVAGILQNTPESGEEAIVRVDGTSLHKVNEACAVHKHLTPANAAGGKGEIVDADNEYFFCETLEAATAQNDLIAVRLCSGFAGASQA